MLAEDSSSATILAAAPVRFGSRPFRPAAFRTFKHFHVRKFLDVAQAILKLAMAACRRHEAVWAGRHLSSPLVRATFPARIPGGPANPLGGRTVEIRLAG